MSISCLKLSLISCKLCSEIAGEAQVSTIAPCVFMGGVKMGEVGSAACPPVRTGVMGAELIAPRVLDGLSCCVLKGPCFSCFRISAALPSRAHLEWHARHTTYEEVPLPPPRSWAFG